MDNQISISIACLGGTISKIPKSREPICTYLQRYMQIHKLGYGLRDKQVFAKWGRKKGEAEMRAESRNSGSIPWVLGTVVSKAPDRLGNSQAWTRAWALSFPRD